MVVVKMIIYFSISLKEHNENKMRSSSVGSMGAWFRDRPTCPAHFCVEKILPIPLILEKKVVSYMH